MVLPLVGIAAGVAARAIAKKVAQEAIKKAAQNAAKKSVVKKVTAKEAKDIAKSTVGKYPPSGPPREIAKRGTGLSPREAKVVSIKQPVTKNSGRSFTKEELDTKIAVERSTRLKRVLTPTKSNSIKKIGPENRARPTVTIARAKTPAQEKTLARAKVQIPKDTKMDTSRKTAMKAAEEARSKKNPIERELEQRFDKRGKLGFSRRSSTAPDKDMIEANRRVNEGLKEIKARERAALIAKKNSSKGRTAISKRVTTRTKLSKTRPLGK